MIVSEVFAILKYGINILLVGLGILSFEDISHETKLEDINFVERLECKDREFRNDTYYANKGYLLTEPTSSDNPMVKEEFHSFSKNSETSDICLNDANDYTEDIYIIESEIPHNKEVLIILNNDKFSSETYFLQTSIKNEFMYNTAIDVLTFSIAESINKFSFSTNRK